jgi:hypothetical protein
MCLLSFIPHPYLCFLHGTYTVYQWYHIDRGVDIEKYAPLGEGGRVKVPEKTGENV